MGCRLHRSEGFAAFIIPLMNIEGIDDTFDQLKLKPLVDFAGTKRRGHAQFAQQYPVHQTYARVNMANHKDWKKSGRTFWLMYSGVTPLVAAHGFTQF
jgi:hypothetical protein